MSHIPSILLSLSLFAQSPDPTASPTPPAVQAAVPPPVEAPPAAPVETEAAKFVRESADRVDAIEYVNARIRQTIRASGKAIVSQGVYRRGPAYRSLLELDFELGNASAKRVQASDGKTAIVYEKLLGDESLTSFQVNEVMTLIETRELPADQKRQLYLRLPFVRPGDMLRGYVETIAFDKISDATVGESNPRTVALVEGVWKEELIPLVTGNGNIKKAEDIPGLTPQYARLYLDKETRFPLKIELYRRDKKAEYKPIFTLEFLDVANEKLNDSDFTFNPPETVKSVDMTAQMVAQLSVFEKKLSSDSLPAAGGQKVQEGLAPKP
jgi:outer membrane lipoprotein-sorting protein